MASVDVMDACEASALVTARSAGDRAARFPLVVALHARGSDAGADITRVRALFGRGPDVVALQAARPCNPMQSNLRSVREYAGFSWYLGDDPTRPEPASFGDALAQAEAFLQGIERPFVIAGDEQGAAVATMLAFYAPPRLLGVHAARAADVTIGGWEPPVERLDGMAFAIDGLASPSMLEQALIARGASVTCVASPDLESWLEGRHADA